MAARYIIRQVTADITVVELAGQLKLGKKLTEIEHGITELVHDGLRKLVLDFSNLTFIDSAGVGMLLVCDGTMEQAGGRFAVAGAKGRTKRILDLAHVYRAVPLYPDLASAMTALDQGGGPTPHS